MASAAAPTTIVIANYLTEAGLMDSTVGLVVADTIVGSGSGFWSFVKYLTGMATDGAQAATEAVKAVVKFCKSRFLSLWSFRDAVGGFELSLVEQVVPPMVVSAAVTELTVLLGELLIKKISMSKFADEAIRCVSQYGGALAGGALGKLAVVSAGVATGALVCFLINTCVTFVIAANLGCDRRHDCWCFVRSQGCSSADQQPILQTLERQHRILVVFLETTQNIRYGTLALIKRLTSLWAGAKPSPPVSEVEMHVYSAVVLPGRI